MDEQPERRPRDRDPERALLGAVRLAVLPTLGLPVALASLGAGVTGQGLPVVLASPLAFIALIANVACWLNVIARWQALPPRGDDDDGWPRWWDNDGPLDPSDGPGGPGGIRFDWVTFERDFWEHVRAHEQRRERQLVHAESMSPEPRA
jgi:hypothetical protein